VNERNMDLRNQGLGVYERKRKNMTRKGVGGEERGITKWKGRMQDRMREAKNQAWRQNDCLP